MKHKTAYTVALNIFMALALLMAGDWLAFVPLPKEPPYRFISTWGEKGGAPGQFNDPTGIAVAVTDDGTVFAVDFGNNRVEKWRPAGGRSTRE